MPPWVKATLNGAGTALALAGVIFVALRLHDSVHRLDLERLGPGGWGVLAIAASAYGAANALLATAWWSWLSFAGADAQWGWAVRAYGRSLIAKYIPGNVFQFAGRQALGMLKGIPAGPLAKSTLLELASLSVAGALFVPLIIPLRWQVPPAIGWISFGVALSGARGLARRWLGPKAARALGAQGAFLVLSGGAFVSVLAMMCPQAVTWVRVPTLGGAYVVAWLLGLVTPGAPAGAGIRELVLLFLLGHWVAPADLLLAVVLARLVTVGGDLGFFAFATLAKEQK